MAKQGCEFMGKLSYLTRSILRQFGSERFRCPNCSSENNFVVDRKWVITQLRRCEFCKLLFRTPTDHPAHNEGYYEHEYSQGFTTTLPSDDELETMILSNFAETEKDYSYYIATLVSLGVSHGNRVFDYGCSWGYGSFQLNKAGFDVMAYEVAPSRRDYAQHRLHVTTVNRMEHALCQCARSFDCFFSAHVLEHIPSPTQCFNYAKMLLRPGGLFISFTPNGGERFRASSPDWSKLWGEVHPNFIDEVFLDHSFADMPRVFGSSPVAGARLPDRPVKLVLDSLDRYELFFAARL
jgi:2-polyprenyl-3-methyl-5-hydroxy-6-metoxy-1,4-benzoquinol methylase